MCVWSLIYLKPSCSELLRFAKEFLHVCRLIWHQCHILLHQNPVLVVLTVVKMWPCPLTHIQGTFPCGWFQRQLALWEICRVSCLDVEGRAEDQLLELLFMFDFFFFFCWSETALSNGHAKQKRGRKPETVQGKTEVVAQNRSIFKAPKVRWSPFSKTGFNSTES